MGRLIRSGKKCEKSLKYFLLHQYLLFIFWAVDIPLYLSLIWIIQRDVIRFTLEAGLIVLACPWEVYSLFLTRKMVKSEKSGEFYVFDRPGQKIVQGQMPNPNLNITTYIESVFVEEKPAWPAKEVCQNSTNVPPPNLEIEIQDFSQVK
jgi:hypothetical protein